MNVQQKSYSRAKADGTLDLLGDAGFLEAYAATAKLKKARPAKRVCALRRRRLSKMA